MVSRRYDYGVIVIGFATVTSLSTLRLGVGRALTGVVVGELFFATAGLGFMISIAAQTFDTPRVLLGVFIFSLAGVLAVGLLQNIERRMAPWRLS